MNSVGDNNGGAKINANIVKYIRSSPEKSNVIAQKLGLSLQHIRKIKSGRCWKHVN